MSESSKKPIAVVTGSGGAIGGAIAAKLASEGYLVALTDINESAVKARSATIAGSIA